MSDNDWQDTIDEIHRRREAAKQQGGPEAVQRQHDKGRLTIRERIDALLDAGSFREVGAIAGGAERDAEGNLESFTPGGTTCWASGVSRSAPAWAYRKNKRPSPSR